MSTTIDAHPRHRCRGPVEASNSTRVFARLTTILGIDAEAPLKHLVRVPAYPSPAPILGIDAEAPLKH